MLDGRTGDLVENGAPGLGQVQHIGQVPADGLAFAVGVGRQVDLLHVFAGRAELGQDALLALDNLVARRETLAHVDAEAFERQVDDVAGGGPYLEVGPQEFLDRLRLGRRLDDD